MHPTTIGAQHHRSDVRLPEDFQLYPELLRESGYYCANNAKTDYNLRYGRDVWDESGNTAHYRNRADQQPFFAVFNIGTSHESQVAPDPGEASFRIPPEEIALPPYHPDTPEIRRDWANYYDQIERMDAEAGELLNELESEGLAEETIVFYFSDHGGALPRGKRNIHDSGTRVPFIARIPHKFSDIAPVAAGGWIDEPIDFVDFSKTVLGLAQVEIPSNYQGRVFLGQEVTESRGHVFLYRDRMDERYDTVRAIRDQEYRYVRNFSPHRPWGQHYSYAFEVLPSMRSWFAEFRAGRCDDVEAAYWRAKPSEELYQISRDPHEVHNLAASARHADRIAEMRRILRDEIVASRDTGFIPEAMALQLAGNRTIYEYGQSAEYPIGRVVRLAEKATSRDAKHIPELRAAFEDPHPVLRYWAAIGCVVLEEEAAPLKSELMSLLEDEWADIRIAAAEAMRYHGEVEAALETIAKALANETPYVRLSALNTLEYMWKSGHIPLDAAQNLVRDLTELEEPGFRIPQYLLSFD